MPISLLLVRLIGEQPQFALREHETPAADVPAVDGVWP
jgi:hypothetical protein